MSGQDANLTLEQAKRQQERTSAGQAGTGAHQGPIGGSSKGTDPICEKVAHQGK